MLAARSTPICFIKTFRKHRTQKAVQHFRNCQFQDTHHVVLKNKYIYDAEAAVHLVYDAVEKLTITECQSIVTKTIVFDSAIVMTCTTKADAIHYRDALDMAGFEAEVTEA